MATAPPPTGEPPNPRPRRARNPRLWAIAAAVVVAAVLVGSLAATGAFSSSTSGSTPPAPANPLLTYSGARPMADQLAAMEPDGPWALIVGGGVLSPVNATDNATSGSSDCNITLAPGVPQELIIPAGPPNVTNGSATAWLFFYRNSDSDLLLEAVAHGHAAVIGTVSAPQTCTEVFAYLVEVPADVIDSSAAAAAVQGPAASFLAGHPGAVAAYGVLGGVSFPGHSFGAEWDVNYSSCPLNPTSGETGSAFNATLNATTGTVVFAQTVGPFTCPSGVQLIRAQPHGPAAPEFAETTLAAAARPRD
jgi:hypothetical protein